MATSKNKVLLTIAFAALLLAIPILYAWHHPQKGPALPTYGTVPTATFTDQRGQTFHLDSLRGKVWVADFIFTACRDICPALTQQMKRLQDDLRRNSVQDVMLVSLSVDPTTDTPQALTAYAAKVSADPTNWVFLTGDLQTIEGTIVKGFRVSLDRAKEPAPAQGQESLLSITHGNRFVLVDRAMNIRGYYDVTAEGLDVILKDLKRI